MESFRFNYKTAFIALNGELFLPDIKYSFRSSTSKNQDFQENLRRIVKKKGFAWCGGGVLCVCILMYYYIVIGL